jgi:hypothetical protein
MLTMAEQRRAVQEAQRTGKTLREIFDEMRARKQGVTAMSYTAHEFIIEGDELGEPTGRRETYQAETVSDAVKACVYTHSLANGATHVGATGRVVYSGQNAYVFTGKAQ